VGGRLSKRLVWEANGRERGGGRLSKRLVWEAKGREKEGKGLSIIEDAGGGEAKHHRDAR